MITQFPQKGKKEPMILLNAQEQSIWNEYYLFILDRYQDINAQTIRIASDMADLMVSEYMQRAKVDE